MISGNVIVLLRTGGEDFQSGVYFGIIMMILASKIVFELHILELKRRNNAVIR